MANISLSTLVVDACRTSGIGLKKRLYDNNCIVDMVSSPEECLALCDNAGKSYDIIFTSLRFQQMSGQALAKEISQSHSHIKIAAYSSDPVDKLNLNDFNYYLPKSFCLTILDEIISDCY